MSRDLNAILSSGEIGAIYLGGILSTDTVLKQSEIVTLIGSGETDLSKIKFTEQVSHPAYVEGQFYYKDGDFNMQGEFDDVILQLGKETYIKIINNTGATITNGAACRHNGVVNGKVQATPALADAFVTARILGVAPHDIANGEEGLLTTFGIITGIDTSTLPVGAPLYLSDTVAGTYSSTAPDIATQVGGVLVQDAADGVLFVNSENTIALPTIYGALGGGSAGTSFTANTYQLMGGFVTEDSVLMDTNATLGTITIPEAGRFRLTVNLVLLFDAISNSNEDLFIGLFDDSTGLIKEIQNFIPKSGEGGSFYPSFIFNGVAGRQYHIEVKCSRALSNVTYSLSEYDIESLHIR